MATKFEPDNNVEEGLVSPSATARDVVPAKSKLHHHKDGLHRYADAKPGFKDKDHFLQPDDGKLEVLRVQVAPNNRLSMSLNTTWERPEVENSFKSLWRGFRNAARNTVTWTFNESIKCGWIFFLPTQVLLLCLMIG